MAIIAVAGRKGGLGKSTIVGNLAGEFASMGWSVAALDADPHHSLVAWAEQGDGILSRCVEKVADGAATLRGRARTAEEDADIVLIDTPPGMPETAYQAALAADLMLLPCGPSPLDLFALKEALSLSLKARAARRSKKPRIRFVPSKVLMSTNLGRGLASSLKDLGKKVLPAIGQRVVLAEAVARGLTESEYAPQSPAHEEFRALDALIVDDWAMAPLADAERRAFLEICDERYLTRSTLLTSQLPVAKWHAQIGDPTVADSILDRLVHAAHRIELQGESMRKKRTGRGGKDGE